VRPTICVGALLAAIAASAGPPLAADQGKSGDSTDYGCGGHPPTAASAWRGEQSKRDQAAWPDWWFLNRPTLLGETYRVAGALPAAPPKWRDDVRAALREALDSPTVALASEAALSLGRAGDPRDTELLVKVAGDVRREQNVRRRAALALGLLPVEAATAKSVRDTLFSVLFESVGNNDDRLELWANAAYALGLRGDEAAVPRLAAFLARHLEWNDADHERGIHREVMGGATGALGLFRDPVLVPNLVAALKDRAGEGNLRQRKNMVSTFAAYGLARVGDKSALPALRDAVGDDRSEVRRGALLALGALTDPKDTETIALLAGAVAADKDDTARGFAAISLGRSGADAGPDALRKAYETSGSSTVRAYAALGLGLSARVRPDRAVSEFLLAEVVAKHDTYETGALCIANGLARNFASAERLTQLARSPGDRDMRSHAAFALGLLRAENVPPEVLIELVAPGGDPVIRHEAGLALGLGQRRDGIDALLRVVEDGKGLIERGSAAVALGRIGGAESAPTLLRVLRDDHELNGLRICAAHGLGLLLDDSEGRKLGLVGADVNWVNEINRVWLPTEVLDQMLLIMD